VYHVLMNKEADRTI